jgi:transposase
MNRQNKYNTQSRHNAKPETLPPVAAVLAEIIKVGLDIGLKKYAYCAQTDGSKQSPPQICKPDEFKQWILKQKPKAKQVIVCYEAGLFGFDLARWLKSSGIECLVMAPVKLDEANKRVETDKLNALDICSRLDRYLAGNTRALTVCRIPTLQEELARHQSRQRAQFMEHRKAIQAQGRSLLWQFGYTAEVLTKNWECHLPYLNKEIEEPEVREGLKRLQVVVLEINEQLKQLEQQLEGQAAQRLPEAFRQLPSGLGQLSALVLTLEVMDWGRLKNRRSASCFTGLVPSECSSGESPRQGSVTKVGNRVIRTILIEMAWRMVYYQPQCRAVKKWLSVLQNKKAGSRARKKAIVAVARVLAVDLWRVATGQTTFEKLGFRMSKAK